VNRTHSILRAFTLVELLAVMGIIAILGVVITTSAQRISKDAKLAGATNQVLAALGEARAIAIRDRATVLVAFTVRRTTYRQTTSGPELIDLSKPQQTEVVIAKATGRLGFLGTGTNGSYAFLSQVGANSDRLLEEFHPAAGVPSRLLPAGMKVAGSAMDFPPTTYSPQGHDHYWYSQPEMKKRDSIGLTLERGQLVVIRFGPDGSLETRNPSITADVDPTDPGNSSVNPWIDFNRNGAVEIGTTPTTTNDTKFFTLDEFRDEPLGNHTMFLALFDDDNFHAQATATQVTNWGATSQSAFPSINELIKDRTAYINQFSDRIQFNRFTGVAELVPR